MEIIPLLDTVGVVARKVKMCNTVGVLGIAPAEALAEAQPARVQLKTAYRDPVEGGKAGGKSYEKKRPVAPASGDKIAAEKTAREVPLEPVLMKVTVEKMSRKKIEKELYQ